jgi:hypothetical protein
MCSFVCETAWHQRMPTVAFALCAIRLVKLTPGPNAEQLIFQAFLATELCCIASKYRIWHIMLYERETVSYTPFTQIPFLLGGN